jgi:NAD-dependent deacetylase
MPDSSASASASIRTVALWLSVAQRTVVMSGAGLSKASGIPTYRDGGGLWTDPDKIRFSEVKAYRADPSGFLDFWKQRQAQLAAAEPNPGHHALVELQSLRPNVSLVTQNIDGLLGRAGGRDVYELHGNLLRWRCEACGLTDPKSNEGMCLDCLAPERSVRPDVVMFGETLGPVLPRTEFLAKQSNLFLSVGTSAVVYPAAGLAERAQARGAKIVVINAEPTPLDRLADVTLTGKSEELLPELVQALKAVQAQAQPQTPAQPQRPC